MLWPGGGDSSTAEACRVHDDFAAEVQLGDDADLDEATRLLQQTRSLAAQSGHEGLASTIDEAWSRWTLYLDEPIYLIERTDPPALEGLNVYENLDPNRPVENPARAEAGRALAESMNSVEDICSESA